MGTINHKCQVPTPSEIAKQMLNVIGYTENLYGKRILENSCGEGSFLKEIVHRYIQDSLKHDRSIEEIKEGLQRDIHGFELDKELHSSCIQALTKIAHDYKIEGVHWDIKCKDALCKIKRSRYQFVIGNPPYLAYPELSLNCRQFIRNNFTSCKQGKPDYYFAFIEASLKSLAVDGKMAYLVPGNFMKNFFSQSLRELLLPSLYQITNFSHQRLFEDALTSSVILYCENGTPHDFVHYEDKHYNYICKKSKAELHGKWIFAKETSSTVEGNLLCFSDFFHASAPVATQLNRAFVIRNWEDSSANLIRVGKFDLECAGLRNAAGPKALQKGQQEKIIFPYIYYGQETPTSYTEESFYEKFPGIFHYLQQYQDDLLKRKSDQSAQWFEYGRSQLLKHLNQRKLILSSFVTVAPKVYQLDEYTVPYAGICITTHSEYSVDVAKHILESDDFMNYVRQIGVCTNSGSYRISPTDINKFRFSRKLLEGSY